MDEIKRIYYMHTMYGCSCGCCGHVFIAEKENGKKINIDFRFEHYKEKLDIILGRLANELHAEPDYDGSVFDNG